MFQKIYLKIILRHTKVAEMYLQITHYVINVSTNTLKCETLTRTIWNAHINFHLDSTWHFKIIRNTDEKSFKNQITKYRHRVFK